MEKRTKIILAVVLSILVILVIVQTVQLSTIGRVIVTGASNAQQSAPATGGGMVGGC